MKTISLSLVAVAEASAEADTNARIATEVEAKTAAAGNAAGALVAALRQAGVRIQTASLTFAPRPGSHEAAETFDLTAEPAEAPVAEGPAAGAPTETAPTETASTGGAENTNKTIQ